MTKLFCKLAGWVLLLALAPSCSPPDEQGTESTQLPSARPPQNEEAEVEQLPQSLVVQNGDCWDFSRIPQPWELTVVRRDRFVLTARSDALNLPHAPLDTRAQQKVSLTVAYDKGPFAWARISPSRLSELIAEGVYVEAPEYSVGDYTAYTDPGKDNFIVYLVDFEKNAVCDVSNNLALPNNSIRCERRSDDWTARFRIPRQSLPEVPRVSEEISDLIATLHCKPRRKK